MLLSECIMVAVWPPGGPFASPETADGLAWKIAAVLASLILVIVVSAWSDRAESAEETPGPGRVIDERYRRRAR